MTWTDSDFNTVQDFEVFGVGARRRYELQNSAKPILLVRHPWDFLDGVVEATLTWLKPAQVIERPMPPLAELLRSKFQALFARGHRLLGDAESKILADYVREMPWEYGLLDDHFRYFALSMRRRFPQNPEWAEVFQCEWVRWSRLYENHPPLPAPHGEKFALAPSFQVFALGAASAAVMNIPSGLYACVYDEEAHILREAELSPVEARLIDWIEDEAGFSRPRIRLMMEQEDFVTPEIEAAIARLRELRIIR